MGNVELVAEVGINHNGDINIAKKLIDVAVLAGFDYVKFQKRVVGLVYTEEELNTLRESPWGTTTREQKEGLEFNTSDYMAIDKYCRDKGIQWFASPWDYKSLEFCAKSFKTPFIKIPSALITNDEFLERAKSYKKPIILSTGMSEEWMIERAVDIIGEHNIYCLMHCTSTYPSKPDEQNLKYITRLKEMYPYIKIGFSNHNSGLIYMVGAMALGAEMIEMHITLDRTMYGSDQSASIEPEGMLKLAKYARGMEKALGDGIKCVYESELPIIKKLRR